MLMNGKGGEPTRRTKKVLRGISGPQRSAEEARCQQLPFPSIRLEANVTAEIPPNRAATLLPVTPLTNYEIVHTIPERSSAHKFHHRIFHLRTSVTTINMAMPRIYYIVFIMKTHEWSPKMQNMALGLIAGGQHSLREITNITNIPKGTLGDLKKRGTPISKPCTGRPKKLSKGEKHYIDLYIRRNSTTRRSTPETIIEALTLDASPKTVRTALTELGYTHKVAKCRPFLKDNDRKQRLQYARRHQYWTVEDWKRVIFTDEMSVKIGMERHSRDMVWHKEGEAFHPDCINYQKRPSGVGMMFWGAFRIRECNRSGRPTFPGSSRPRFRRVGQSRTKGSRFNLDPGSGMV